MAGTIMRKKLALSCAGCLALVELLLCFSAQGQRSRPIPSGKPILDLNAVIFEQPNFTGRSAVLSPGDHEITDFRPSSIRVPKGFVALLCEHVANGQGYGI
jgi:hypothetical protein